MSKQYYDSCQALATKFMLPDGTITNALPVTGITGGGGSTDMSATNAILNKQLDIVNKQTTGTFKTITNPTNLNINTLAPTARKVNVVVVSGSVACTSGGNTSTIKEAFSVSFGNGTNPTNTNIVLNGTCELLVGWEV